mmetsp:Transcript_5712/g.13858  ORF Transcript_5712/g.13858 Transcript_5712/m.13858 type:complete len:244 (+) Transcript_5712:79-810(+)
MQIFVRTFENKTLTLHVDGADTILDLKSRIQEKEGLLVDDVRFSCGGRPLHDGRTVADCDLRKECTLDLDSRLRGGHCQVPCGIFDDPRLVVELKEACATIKKACFQIGELSASPLTALSLNQMSRWTSTKEEHASKVVSSILEYCLCQRVKPTSDPKSPFKCESDYVEAMKSHHAATLLAVKCKQTADVENADKLGRAIGEMCRMYQPASPADSDSRPVDGGADTATPLAATTGCGSGCALQ